MSRRQKSEKAVVAAVVKNAGERRAHEAERRAVLRGSMIAEAAYYRAEKRGFAPGSELDDWLAAEADLEQLPLAS